MKKTVFAISAAMGMIVILLSSCQDSVNMMENTPPSMTIKQINTDKVITDGGLADDIRVDSLNTSMTNDGLMQIQCTLRNLRTSWWDSFWYGNETYNVLYRVTWFNASGMVVDTGTNVWLPVNIMPGDTAYISAIAPSSLCKDFVLKLREE